MSKPRIAIPVTIQDVSNYFYAMHFAGADPVVVSPIDRTGNLGYLQAAHFRVSEFDGLLLPGGGDINPLRYHQQLNGSKGIHDDLDVMQFLMLDAFVSHKKPVFGICRGLQLINVYFGGSLVQDLATAKAHARDYPPLQNPDKKHTVRNEEGSWAWELYGETCEVNSAHHQAVDRIGDGLVADSRAQGDQVVEAMHHETLPLWGVQYHPERMSFTHARKDTSDGRLVLEYFVGRFV